MRACDAVRRAAGPHRQVQPFLSGCGLGSRRISSSIHQICVRSRSASTLGGELPTPRCGLRITFVSSKWTTRKVDQVPNTEAFANLPQLRSGGRKETAQQSIPAEPLHPLMPALGAAIQPLEDPGQLGRESVRFGEQRVHGVGLMLEQKKTKETKRIVKACIHSSGSPKSWAAAGRISLFWSSKAEHQGHKPGPALAPRQLPATLRRIFPQRASSARPSAGHRGQRAGRRRARLERGWPAYEQRRRGFPVVRSVRLRLLVLKNHHRDRSSQHHPRARVAEGALSF
jgi:hypothetical protein